MSDFHYQEIQSYTTEEALAALARNIADELRLVVIGVSSYHDDAAFAEDYCLKLVDHENEIVRGNAVLGLGHIARRFRRLNERDVKQILESSLIDHSEYVRGQAWAAADDISHFLGWQIRGFES